MLLVLFLSIAHAVNALLCLQCDGRNFSHGLKLSLDDCCHVSFAVCSKGQVCIRAFVSAPNRKFFLSGCHEPEDGLIGCDTHSLPFNATVHRCACTDSKCQLYFPKSCSSRITSTSTSSFANSKYHHSNDTIHIHSHHHSQHHHKHHHHKSVSTTLPPISKPPFLKAIKTTEPHLVLYDEALGSTLSNSQSVSYDKLTLSSDAQVLLKHSSSASFYAIVIVCSIICVLL